MRRWQKGAARIIKIEEQKRSYAYAGKRLPYFVPKVEFAYEVSGRQYTGSRFSVHNFTIGAKGEGDEVVGGAKVGEVVEVFYDPTEPSRASLTLPSYDGVVVTVFLGCGLLALVLLLTFAS